MNYRVEVVKDSELPEGIVRVIVERRGKCPLLILAESVAGSRWMIQRWEADQREPAEAFELRVV